MVWNYRIIKNDKVYYVSEVFYDENWKIEWFSEPIVVWDSKQDLIEEIKVMLEDIIDKEVLNEEELLKNSKGYLLEKCVNNKVGKVSIER